MMRTVVSLMPIDRRGLCVRHLALISTSTVLRAIAAVLMVPLVSALFGDDPAGAWPWVAALTGAVAGGWVVDSVASRIGFDLGFTLLDRAQRDISTQVTRIPLRWFTEDNAAGTRRAIAATGPDLVGLFAYLLTPLIQAILLPIAIALALVPIAWQLGAVALLAVPLLLGALWATGYITRRADQVATRSNSALTERILEFARIQAALRAARRVEPARSQASSALAAQHSATVRLLMLNIPGQVLFSLASQAALLLLAGTTTWLTFHGHLGKPEAVALIVVIVRFLEPFTSLADLAPAIETSRSTLRDVGSVIDAPGPALDVADETRLLEPEAAAVDIRDVYFGYETSAPVFEGLGLEFRAGDTTAIVGPSGSGKSTILSLVAGLEQPNAGSVSIDGAVIVDGDMASQLAATSMVFQQPYLFAGTIRENVLAGDPTADAEQLATALRLARVEEFASQLPDGLDTAVGEAGTALSGGERQRVSIARALLKPSTVLLVDEGTSALDAENEAAVVAAIADDPQRRTRIVVTHRLSTIAGADRVLFIDGGAVVEDGTVEELLAAQGRFADYWSHQHAAQNWRISS